MPTTGYFLGWEEMTVFFFLWTKVRRTPHDLYCTLTTTSQIKNLISRMRKITRAARVARNKEQVDAVVCNTSHSQFCWQLEHTTVNLKFSVFNLTARSLTQLQRTLPALKNANIMRQFANSHNYCASVYFQVTFSLLLPSSLLKLSVFEPRTATGRELFPFLICLLICIAKYLFTSRNY